MKKNKIKNTGLEITELSFGTSSLGSMPDTYGYEVPEERAQKTLNRFFQGPVNMLDTSRNYAMGESEIRIGKAIKENGGWPKGFLLSTKLYRNMDTLVLDKISTESTFKVFKLSSKDSLALFLSRTKVSIFLSSFVDKRNPLGHPPFSLIAFPILISLSPIA